MLLSIWQTYFFSGSGVMFSHTVSQAGKPLVLSVFPCKFAFQMQMAKKVVPFGVFIDL